MTATTKLSPKDFASWDEYRAARQEQDRAATAAAGGLTSERRRDTPNLAHSTPDVAMPALRGSDKQTTWAGQIRTDALTAVDARALALHNATDDATDAGRTHPYTHEQITETHRAVYDLAATYPQANFWIDTRDADWLRRAWLTRDGKPAIIGQLFL